MAAKIQEIVGTEIAGRTIEYRDIGILLRSTRNRAKKIMEIFSEEGIPVIYEGEDKKVDAREITVFLNLLKLIDNHRQDIPLLTVMRLPMFGFSLDDDAEIRIAYPEETFFFEAVERYRDEMVNDLAERLKVFYEKLSGWRELSKHLDIDDFLWRLLLESNYYSFVGAQSNGRERKRNLRLLLERAVSYKESSLKGLPSFLQYVSRLHKREQVLLNSGSGADSENAVRLMTIHKSKGLEFPVLFVADIARNFQIADRKGELIYNKRVGYGAKYRRFEENILVEYNSILFDAIVEQQNSEEMSEEMRILYVALTRARDQLYLVGTVKNLQKSIEEWQKGVDPDRLLGKKTFLDWVMSALYRPQLEGLEEMNSVTAGSWKLNYLPEITEGGEETEIETEETPGYEKVRRMVFEQMDRDAVEQINNRPVKMSVTHLKRYGLDDVEEVELTPLDEKVERADYSAIGTAVHKILQRTDLTKAGSIRELVLQVEEIKRAMLSKREITEEIYQALDTRMIVDFYTSPLGRRLIQSYVENPKNVLTEMPFSLDVLPSEVESLSHLEERPVEISGIIDCCFIEDGEWVLIDYKTDRNYNESVARQRLEEYRLQVELYRRALEKLTGISVKEKHIYYLNQHEDVIS